MPDAFDPDVFGYVRAIAMQADGKVLAGGGFVSVGGESRFIFARLSNDTAALQNLAVTQTTIIWTPRRLQPAIRHALPLSIQPTM